MKNILLPQKAMVTPKEVLEEISKFEYINKSPYSKTYYNVPGITWDYKPEGSLRISDHWNFISNGSRHCILAHTEESIENYWMLAKYIDGKYYVLKEFGGNVHGYRFNEVSKKDLELLKDLYENSSKLDELCKSDQGVNELINTYKAYKFNKYEIESFEKIYILILDNTMAIDFVIP